MDQREIIEQLKSVLAGKTDLRLAYLFGSQVKAATGPLSDIDLGVLFTMDSDLITARTRLAHELGKTFPATRFDIVPLQGAPVELAYAIISQGVCVYQSSILERVEFEANVLSRYGDYLPVLHAQRTEILGDLGHERRIQRYREALRRTERTLSQIRAAAR